VRSAIMNDMMSTNREEGIDVVVLHSSKTGAFTLISIIVKNYGTSIGVSGEAAKS
jgi:hypothetical protein